VNRIANYNFLKKKTLYFMVQGILIFIFSILFYACNDPPPAHPGPDDPRDAPVRPIAPDRRLAPKTDFVRNTEPFPWRAGADVIPSFAPQSRVWAPTPIGRTWDVVNFAVATVHRVEGNQVVLRAGQLEFTVPAAVLLPVRSPGKLAGGTPVLAAMGLTGEWAKVVESTDQAVTVHLVFAQEVVARTLAPDAVLPLDKKGPGSPVAVWRQNGAEFGMLIYLDGERAGVIGYAGRLDWVPAAQVRFVPLDIALKKNVSLMSPYADRLEEVRVLEVLENGAAARVLFVSRPEEPGINPRVVPYARLTRMLW